MGLGSRTSATYAYVKEGHFVVKHKEVVEGKEIVRQESFDYVDGVIADVQIREETYNEETYDELQIRVKDDSGVTVIVGRANSWFGINFFQRIVNADVTKPLRLGVYGSKADDAPVDAKPTNFAYLYQGGQKIEPNRDVVPKPEKVTVAKKTVVDYTKSVEAMHKIVAEVKAKIAAGPTIVTPGQPAPTGKDDDLPF